jgi:hypothetical protein
VVNTPVVAPPSSALPPTAPQFPISSAKTSAPVVVAKIETAELGPEAEKAPEARSAPAPDQQPANPLSHAFDYIVGALRVPAASAWGASRLAETSGCGK